MPLPRHESVRVPPAPLPWFAKVVLVDAPRVERRLGEVAASGLVPRVPNTWQIALGVLRMWHRLLFRSEEIGTSANRPRPNLRARLLHFRPFRFPFLLRERAVAPHDFSGLLSDRERILRHLVGAHHEGPQFVYDLEILSIDEGAFEELVRRARKVVENDTPRTRWLRDLTVFEGYHESLLAAAERAVKGEFEYPEERAADPDTRFIAYLAWCARQPATYERTLTEWRAGRYTVADGLLSPNSPPRPADSPSDSAPRPADSASDSAPRAADSPSDSTSPAPFSPAAEPA
ncbi:MAG: hypothetical protein R3B70_32855 [Polyangiaceae bacterium]